MNIIGRDSILQFLKKAHAKSAIPHAIFFWGRRHSGKGTLAEAIARTLLCDKNIFLGCGECAMCVSDSVVGIAHIIRPETVKEEICDTTRGISIDVARAIQEKIGKTSLVNKPYIVIIEHAEGLTREASNCFLKTIEEPPENVYFVMSAETRESILLTIVSRSVTIRVPAVSTRVFEEYCASHHPNMSENERGTLARFAQGLPGKFFLGLSDPSNIREAQKNYSFAYALLSVPPYQFLQKVDDMIKNEEPLQQYVEYFFGIIRSLFLASRVPEHSRALKISSAFVKKFEERYTTKEYVRVLSALFRTQTILSETNVNPRIAFENFLLEL